jgi:hypothetical protein
MVAMSGILAYAIGSVDVEYLAEDENNNDEANDDHSIKSTRKN